jgi:hypothetical protein
MKLKKTYFCSSDAGIMKQKVSYTVLFVLSVVLLAFPAVQQYAKLFDFKPLNGVTEKVEQPQLNFKNWMTGTFQKQEERYLSENIGFRELFVRCYNQMSWSLFRKVQNKSIFINDENWIFNDFTIKHHYGQSMYDYVGSNEEAIRKMTDDALMIFKLQHVLQEYGTTFFVCLAPGKDMVCDAYLPEVKGFTRPPGILAIDFYPPLFDSLGINYIDFSKYCMEIRDTLSYPLYLKSSSHWSTQAAEYIADSLFNYMEALSGLNIRELSWSEPYLAPTRDPDADLEEVMNLFWPIESGMNYYVDVGLVEDTTADKPKWLTVGDSYYWEWQYNLPLDQMFEYNHYWYYNNTVHNDPFHGNVSEVDLLRELISTDVIMLLYSPCNLFDLNRQFLTRSLFSLLYEDGVAEDKLEKIKQDIRNTPEWYGSIEQNAIANGQNVEQSIEDNARYLLMSQPGLYFDEFNGAVVPECRNSRIDKVLMEINNPERDRIRRQMLENEEWLNSIREKAALSNITIDEAINKDIDWVLRE